MEFDKYFLQTYDKPYRGGDCVNKVVFISHITEEAPLAKMLKEEINEKFMGLVDVFVSSDGASIQAGTEWLEQIKNGVNNADLMIALCSKKSVNRAWVNFEVGAGWMKGIHVIPACHTDLLTSQLPSPMNMLQGVSLSSDKGLTDIFTLIAKMAGADVTNKKLAELSELGGKINTFEHNYGFLTMARDLVGSLHKNIPVFKQIFKEAVVGNPYTIQMKESDYLSNKIIFDELKRLNIMELALSPNSNTALAPGGIFLDYNFRFLPKFSELK